MIVIVIVAAGCCSVQQAVCRGELGLGGVADSHPEMTSQGGLPIGYEMS